MKNKLKKGVCQNTQDPNKIYPLHITQRLFSHALPRRLLPKGGRVKLLHLAKHKISNTVRNSYCKQHDYTTNIHWIDTYINIQFIVHSVDERCFFLER